MQVDSALSIEKPAERPGRFEALAPRPARGVGGFAGLAAVLAGHRGRVGRAADLRLDLGDHRRVGAAVSGRLLRHDQRAGRRAGAGLVRRDDSARSGRPQGRLSALAGCHLPDGRGAGRSGQAQAGSLQRDFPRLGGRGDARGDRALDHRQAIAADLRQSGQSSRRTSSGASCARHRRDSWRWTRRSSAWGSSAWR